MTSERLRQYRGKRFEVGCRQTLKWQRSEAGASFGQGKLWRKPRWMMVGQLR